MKLLVCIKQVPQKDAPLKLNEQRSWIREDVSYEVNEPDAYALEEALRQKEKHGGEVVVLTAGPARAQQVLREALAKGADRAKFAKARSYMVRRDDLVACKNIRCRKRFEVSGVQTVIFLDEAARAPVNMDDDNFGNR